MTTLGFFTLDGDRLVPEPYASSLWGADQMHGVAAGGAMARAAEARLAERSDLAPVRFTLDLFRPVRMQPCELRTRVVREGRRTGQLLAMLVTAAGEVPAVDRLVELLGPDVVGVVHAVNDGVAETTGGLPMRTLAGEDEFEEQVLGLSLRIEPGSPWFYPATLVLAGDRDLSTPLPWPRAELKLLPHGRLVFVHGMGHSTQRNPQARAAVEAFLLHG